MPFRSPLHTHTHTLFDVSTSPQRFLTMLALSPLTVATTENHIVLCERYCMLLVVPLVRVASFGVGDCE